MLDKIMILTNKRSEKSDKQVVWETYAHGRVR